MQEKSFYAIVIAIVVIGGVGIGIAYYHQPASAAPQPTTSPYDLTLVITTNSIFNQSVQDQPAFFVLNNGTLQSSADIHLPANRLINLTIINYDDGPAAPLGPPNATSLSYYNVSGTVGDVMQIVNNTNVNSSQPSTGNISISGGETVSNLPEGGASHTFTVPSLNLNIPIPPSSVIHAQLYITHTGNFYWQCEAPCGSGVDGWGGAMATAGWMTGTVVVS